MHLGRNVLVFYIEKKKREDFFEGEGHSDILVYTCVNRKMQRGFYVVESIVHLSES